MVTVQSLICQFVYTYLLQQISPNFKLNPKQNAVEPAAIEAQTQQYIALYKNMQRFIRSLSFSKHPNTIMWLLEIMHLVANKFKLDDSKLDKRMKNEFHEQLEALLRSSTEILTDSFNINFVDSYHGLSAISFSPTVYEMLKRYEWVRLKGPPDYNSGEHT